MTSSAADLDSQPRSPRALGTSGGEVNCRRCQQANSAARRFCAGCGQSLWEQCPACQTECSADERFCGSCGVEIAVELRSREQACEAAIAEAHELVVALRHEDALRALARAAAERDARLAPWANRAREAMERVENDRVEQLALAQDALGQAQELFANHAYERALMALDQVPALLRTAEHEALLTKAQRCRQEVLSLSGEIRAAVEERRTGDLLPKLERLLALVPNHAQARQLAGQLAESFIKRARQHLAQHEYQPALDQLEQIPSIAEREEAAQLRDTARELASLLAAVKDGALADRNLVELAERLGKLAPTNAAAAKLRGQVVARAKTEASEPRLGAPNWSPPPQRTLVGPPVEWLANFARAKSGNEAVARTLAEHPGQFFTALGLALTGAGLAAVDADLTPRGREGLLGKLPALSFGRRGPVAAWGIDLSDYALKAVRVVPADGEITIEAAEYILHKQSLSHASAEVIRGEILAATAQNFAARAGELKGIKTCIGLPGQRVLGRFFELPPMPARKVAEAVQYEARHQLPVGLEELCWSYAIQNEQPGRAADQAPRRVLLQAAREAHVRDRLGLFKAAGLSVDLVQSDCLALASALEFELFAENEADKAGKAIAAIDVGDASTNVVVCSPGRCWFRTFGAGGESFGPELVRQLELTHDQAGQVLRQPAKARRFYEWSEALQPLFVQLGSEVERSLATYQKANRDQVVHRVYGLGGAFQTHGLLRYLRSGK